MTKYLCVFALLTRFPRLHELFILLLISASGLLVYLVAMPYAHIILRFALKLSSLPFAPVIRILRRVCLALTTGTPQPPQNSLPIAVAIPLALKQIEAFEFGFDLRIILGLSPL